MFSRIKDHEKYCASGFQYISIAYFLFMISLMMVVIQQSLSKSSITPILIGAPLIIKEFIGYFQNRLLFSMCSKNTMV